jgi:hypothetical protein
MLDHPLGPDAERHDIRRFGKVKETRIALEARNPFVFRVDWIDLAGIAETTEGPHKRPADRGPLGSSENGYGAGIDELGKIH